MKTADAQNVYDVRFYKFLRGIIRVSAMKPKSKYLYPIMDGVPFKDLETAILMAHIEHENIPTNDNDRG
jgi:hypothetical protein